MIPPFNDFGCLPPGVHPATLEEIDARFGHASEIRRVQMESIRWMAAGAERVVLNGSFVTDIMEPNDVDCVLLFRPGAREDRQAFRMLKDGLPFLGMAIVLQREFDLMVNQIFASDRHGTAKGMVEVIA
ncbi:hypothetical protein RAS1_44010 [Phycisphaerae bacterium RAS1]|nr:hypothetical protein RAS1_44010 [Phycisphaerae bacterium RAS1]